jgi:hypothetical protein
VGLLAGCGCSTSALHIPRACMHMAGLLASSAGGLRLQHMQQGMLAASGLVTSGRSIRTTAVEQASCASGG